LDSRGLQQIKDRLNDYTDDSFETLFEEFSVWNAYPSYYYGGLFEDFYPDDNMESIYLANFTYNDDINNLSSNYLVYDKQDCDGYNVTVTIKQMQNTNFKINVIKKKQINGKTEYSNTRYDGSSYNSISIPLEFSNVQQTVIVLTNISSTELINFEYSVSYSHPTKRLYTGTTELKKHDHVDTMGYSFLPPKKGLYQIKVPSAIDESDIMIVDNDPNLYGFNIIKKFQNIPYYQSNASNIRFADNFVVHLDNNILYYFLLNFTFTSESLNITITYLNSYETVDSNIGYSITKNTEKGDCLNQLFFVQSGRYELELQYSDLPILKYTLLKMDANNNASIVGLSQISSTSSNTKFELDIKEGTKIWLGYLDNYTDYTITLKITRKTGYHIRLIPDPKFVDRSILGSEVNIRNGNLESNIITVGYTRTVYIHPDEADVSRLLYDWYSTNSNIARVSNFGTVTGISPGVATIRSILKSDPGIVGELQIVVLTDNSTEARLVKLTTDKRESSPFAGSEVNSGKGYPGKKTIHIGYTRLLCFDNSDPTQLAPSSSIQDYTWISSNSSIASVSSYGTITANGVGVAEIIGYYKYNSNFTAKIEITVVPN
jgi:hypothetical protein